MTNTPDPHNPNVIHTPPPPSSPPGSSAYESAPLADPAPVERSGGSSIAVIIAVLAVIAIVAYVFIMPAMNAQDSVVVEETPSVQTVEPSGADPVAMPAPVVPADDAEGATTTRQGLPEVTVED